LTRFSATLLVTLFALVACASDPEARLQFGDPRMRGSLTNFDVAIVPEVFQGLWANSVAACRHAPDGILLYVHEQVIGDMSVTRVAGYSDDGTAVRVDLASPYSDATYEFYFELARDERHVRVTGRDERTHTLYYRCP
jgi:hypothetical protein